jgi:hypothetical protein
MSSIHNGGDDDATSLTPMIGIPPVELLMFAIPHQQVDIYMNIYICVNLYTYVYIYKYIYMYK